MKFQEIIVVTASQIIHIFCDGHLFVASKDYVQIVTNTREEACPLIESLFFLWRHVSKWAHNIRIRVVKKFGG